jgi:hypothetical protein
VLCDVAFMLEPAAARTGDAPLRAAVLDNLPLATRDVFAAGFETNKKIIGPGSKRAQVPTEIQ